MFSQPEPELNNEDRRTINGSIYPTITEEEKYKFVSCLKNLSSDRQKLFKFSVLKYEIFSPGEIQVIKNKHRKEYIDRIENSLDLLILRDNPKDNIKNLELIKILKNLLENIKSCPDSDYDRFLENTYKDNGRKFIFGAAGGVFLILSHYDQVKKLLGTEKIPENYLEKKKYEKGSKNKIKIGEGTFGRVKLAMSLLSDKNHPTGRLICVKIHKPKANFIEIPLKEFSKQYEAEMINSPKPLDILICKNQKDQKKAYNFMELIPYNTLDNYFKNVEKLEPKVAYNVIYDVLLSLFQLAEKNMVYLDIKPANIIYNEENNRATLIDIGCISKFNKKEEITSFNRDIPIEFTKKFAAEELKKDDGQSINLLKCASFACGKLIDLINNTGNLKLENLKKLSERLMIDRIPFEEVLETIKKLVENEESRKQREFVFDMKINDSRDPLFFNFKKVIRSSRIQANEYLPLYFLKHNFGSSAKVLFNPSDTFDIEKVVSDIKNNKKKVFLLLGGSGTGKTETLRKIKDMLLSNWKPGYPIPIYFSLATTTTFQEAVEKINLKARTKFDLQKWPFTLIIDDFEKCSKRKALNESFIDDLFKQGNIINLILASTPSGTFVFDTKKEKRLLWELNCPRKIMLKRRDLENIFPKILSQVFFFEILKYNHPAIKKANLNHGYFAVHQEKIFGAKQNFNFTITTIDKLLSLNYLHENKKIEITKVNPGKLLQIELECYISQKLENSSKEKRKFLGKILKVDFIKKGDLFSLGQLIATEIFINESQYLTEKSTIVTNFGFDLTKQFDLQPLYYLLDLLPLGITVYEDNKVVIRFLREKYYYYFLLLAINKTILQTSFDSFGLPCKILSFNLINRNHSLLAYLAKNICPQSSEILRKITLTNSLNGPKKLCALVANSMALFCYRLSSAKNLKSEIFEDICIRGADLSSTTFQKCSFNNVDFREVNLNQVFFLECNFKKCNFRKARIDINTYFLSYLFDFFDGICRMDILNQRHTNTLYKVIKSAIKSLKSIPATVQTKIIEPLYKKIEKSEALNLFINQFKPQSKFLNPSSDIYKSSRVILNFLIELADPGLNLQQSIEFLKTNKEKIKIVFHESIKIFEYISSCSENIKTIKFITLIFYLFLTSYKYSFEGSKFEDCLMDDDFKDILKSSFTETRANLEELQWLNSLYKSIDEFRSIDDSDKEKSEKLEFLKTCIEFYPMMY